MSLECSSLTNRPFQEFPLDFDSHLLKNGIDGLPAHITHPNSAPLPRQNRLTGGGGRAAAGGLPSLRPTEQAGSCQRYTGTICSEYIMPSDFIFVSHGLTQACYQLSIYRVNQNSNTRSNVLPFIPRGHHKAEKD